MSSIEDSKNRFNYDCTNGSSESFEFFYTSSSGTFEIVPRTSRQIPAIDYNVFTIAGIRDSREGRENIRIVEERERKGITTERGGNKHETCRQA